MIGRRPDRYFENKDQNDCLWPILIGLGNNEISYLLELFNLLPCILFSSVDICKSEHSDNTKSVLKLVAYACTADPKDPI